MTAPPGVQFGAVVYNGITKMDGVVVMDKAIHHNSSLAAVRSPNDGLTASQRAQLQAIFTANRTCLAAEAYRDPRPPAVGQAAFVEAFDFDVDPGRRRLAAHWLERAARLDDLDPVPSIQWFEPLPAAELEEAKRARRSVFVDDPNLLGLVRGSRPSTVYLNADQPLAKLIVSTFHETRHVRQGQDGRIGEDRDWCELDAQRHAAFAAPNHLRLCTECHDLMQGAL